MEDMKAPGLEAFEKTAEISESKCYIFDMIYEGMEQDAICDFSNKIYENEEKAEAAVTRFLVRTLDLPVLMKMPSRSMLKDQIYRCREEMDALEEKIKKEPGKKEEARLSLNRLYLKGLNEKMEKYYGEMV